MIDMTQVKRACNPAGNAGATDFWLIGSGQEVQRRNLSLSVRGYKMQPRAVNHGQGRNRLWAIIS